MAVELWAGVILKGALDLHFLTDVGTGKLMDDSQKIIINKIRHDKELLE